MRRGPEAPPVATPSPAAVRRQPIITLRMDDVASELQQHKAGTPRAAPWRAAPQQALLRSIGFCRFCCACAVGACASMAPPALAAAEAVAVALIYLLAVPNAFPTRTGVLRYTFHGSAEDVVALSLLRCAAVTIAYSLGAGPRLQRPYMLTALACAALSLPLGLMKLAVLRHSQWAHTQWPPFIALYALHMLFAVAHVLAAQRIVEWARNRWDHGLGGWGFPWQEGEEAWLVAGQLQSQAEEGQVAAAAEGSGGDVPAERLADPDSRWVEVGGVRVHYKLALPQGCSRSGGTAVVLVHSFGGGVFSWRHVQQPLADASGLPVLAFDRPGFGLTDRPAVEPKTPPANNPYAPQFQAMLTLRLADALGFRHIVLAGHDDGALLALMAAAVACREQAALGGPLSQASSLPVVDGDADTPRSRPATDVMPVSGRTVRHTRRGSLPDSLDWAWMSSQPEGGFGSVLERLLRGEWPASIEPQGSGGGSLLAGWAGHRASARHSPLRQQAAQRGGTGNKLLQPFLEDESQGDSSSPDQQPHAAPRHQPPPARACEAGLGNGLVAHDNPSFLSASSSRRSSMEQPEWVPQQEASVAARSGIINNPSFLSEGSDCEESRRCSTQEAVVPLPLRAKQQEGESQEDSVPDEAAGVALELHGNPAYLSGSSSRRSSMEQPAFLPQQEASGAGQMIVINNDSFLSSPTDETAATARPSANGPPHDCGLACAAAQQAGEALQGPATAPPPDLAAEVSSSLASAAGDFQLPTPVGLILLHPDLSGGVAPKYARVLAHSRLGRRVLRSLLRTEMGEVTNRRAWADPHRHLTPDLLALYRRPLHVLRWDMALIEAGGRGWQGPVARACTDLHSLERAQLLTAVADAGLLVLALTGDHDRMVPPSAVSRVIERLGAAAPRYALLPHCGHLSHEEAPEALVAFMRPFLLDLPRGSAP